jgi:hypothetical protein
MGLVATLVFVTGALAASDDSCCSNAVAQLEAKWQARFDKQDAEMRDMREALLRLQPATKPAPAPSTVTQPAPAPSTVKFGVDGTGAGRALSESASSSIASPAFLTHEFSDGHSCPNLNTSRPKMLLPVKSDGTLSWSKAPSNLPADANVSLVAVETDWSTSEVSSFPNPFKIHHGADCSAAPTLELPLATTLGGRLVTRDVSWAPANGQTSAGLADLGLTSLDLGATVQALLRPFLLSFLLTTGTGSHAGYGNDARKLIPMTGEMFGSWFDAPTPCYIQLVATDAAGNAVTPSASAVYYGCWFVGGAVIKGLKFKVTSSSGLLHVTPLAAGYHENAASYEAAHLFPFESFWNSQDGYTVTGWPNIASEYALTALRYIIVQDP